MSTRAGTDLQGQRHVSGRISWELDQLRGRELRPCAGASNVFKASATTGEMALPLVSTAITEPSAALLTSR